MRLTSEMIKCVTEIFLNRHNMDKSMWTPEHHAPYVVLLQTSTKIIHTKITYTHTHIQTPPPRLGPERKSATATCAPGLWITSNLNGRSAMIRGLASLMQWTSWAGNGPNRGWSPVPTDGTEGTPHLIARHSFSILLYLVSVLTLNTCADHSRFRCRLGHVMSDNWR